MASSSPARLEQLAEFSPLWRSKLAELRISTAEQFASIAATSEGRAGIIRHLEIAADDLAVLTRAARAVLSKETLAEIDHPVERQFGLGALDPSDKD